MKKKVIITGPPGSGKSTLLHALEKQGFQCMQEVSRAIIRSEQNLGKDGMPWKNMERFAQLVFNKTLTILPTDQSTFCDRSLVDTIAYLEDAQVETLKELKQFKFHDYYHSTVFFTPPWSDIYTQDPQRPQQFEEHIALSEKLKEVYIRLGFRLIQVPLTNIKTRVKFITRNSSIIINTL